MTPAKTAFPEFTDLENLEGKTPTIDDAADAVSVDSNDGDSNNPDFVKKFNKREAAFRRKEDQDVAVFLALVDKMSVQSLLFILQGHARSMYNIQQKELRQSLQQIMKSSKRVREGKKIVKKLRFAEIMGGHQIQEEIREIIHVSEISDEDRSILWWSGKQMRQMKTEAAKVVRFFKEHRPEYSASVSILCASHLSGTNEILVERHMKKLTQNSFPRGLECHIVPALNEVRAEGIRSVMEEQKQFFAKRRARARDVVSSSNDNNMQSSDMKMKDHNNDVEMEEMFAFWETARKKYVAASVPCLAFAVKIAECDHVEALKASLSKWTDKTAFYSA
eukprot:CAMPEP_0198152584 /NCGR_PEP_ID=MMETSP1443-20131203/60443_1 /TAXON_ID=186043 /ORGANISM="Entomoneis sp., Strain CCMP2396" /LENGTH=333 /DNA_ID=CAMNT_0043818653 /DNA_START=1 /DNA_END=998 /DNA_ORIENTATION=+